MPQLPRRFTRQAGALAGFKFNIHSWRPFRSHAEMDVFG
jgi:hypothetical protein